MTLGAPQYQWTVRFEGLSPAVTPRHKLVCTQTKGVASLGKIVCSNGVNQFKFYCLECGGLSNPIAHTHLVDVEKYYVVPVLNDFGGLPCERCGSSEGSEKHHWAPKHLFNDAETWPKSYLCRECHARWHAVVTPNMGGRS